MKSKASSSSISICRKRGDREKTTKDEDEDEEDKISKLPDEILGHFLSYIPTRDAVRTSILSRRWRYVWISVPCIVLDDSYRKYRNCQCCFAKAVDRVLRLNELYSLRKFSLRWNETAYDESRVSEWISNAIVRRSVEELVLRSRLQCVELPLKIFTSEKLVVLKLGCRKTLLNVPVPVCLPRLKIIHLHSVRLCNEDSMKNLLEGCPVLEELDFMCDSDDELGFTSDSDEELGFTGDSDEELGDFDDLITTLFVRSSSLKRLKLWTRCKKIKLGIVVDTPNLERLHIQDNVTKKFDVKDLSSLIQVTLALDFSPYSRGAAADIYSNRISELLGKMSNAKYMTIYSGTMNSLRQARLDTLPTFHNLTDLYVEHYAQNSGEVLPSLLECMPKLINLRYGSSSYLQCREPKCLMLYLEKIRLVGFNGCPGEMKMIMYFLKSAPVLKKVSIVSSFSCSKENPMIREKVSVLQSRSTACLIEFQESNY